MAVHDLYRAFSADMAARLEQGDIPWAPAASGRPVRWNGQPYGGVSVLAQWSAMREEGYDSALWLSRSAIDGLGGRVVDGARPVTAWYHGRRPVAEEDPASGEMVTRVGERWRPYAVWHVEATEGLAGVVDHVDTMAPRDDGGRSWPRSERLASLMKGVGFDPERVPWAYQGDDVAHCLDLVRWTGFPPRLNRQGHIPLQDRGAVDRALEELTIEIGKAFLVADLRLPQTGAPPHPPLVEEWCRLLRSDSLALFRCARAATRAVDYLHERAPGHRVVGAAAGTLGMRVAGDPPTAGTIASAGQEFRLDADPETTTRDQLKADNWYLGGATVDYRNLGPHGRPAGPWRIYGDPLQQVPAARAAAARRGAREFVADAEACRRDGDADQAARLLDAARRIDIHAPDVATAIRAAAFLQGGGAVSAADWMAGFRRDAEALLRGERAAGHDLAAREVHAGRRGVSF